MPRRPPFNPTGYYHVSTRGNFGEPLFQSPGECELYLELYTKYAEKFEWTTLAWALIWNHHHFLIKLSDDGLSEGMRRINHCFSRRMNAAAGRTGKGHLVRHSFFADEITSNRQLLAVLRYIELNAVEAKLCLHPEDWEWCSYGATIGRARRRRFHDVHATLRFFDPSPVAARAAYARLVADTVPRQGSHLRAQQAARG